jgi:hypothetical protein
MENIKIFTVIFLFFAFFSCKNNDKKAEAENIVAEWIGKEIRFPDNFQCNLSGKDTASVVCSGLLNPEEEGYFNKTIEVYCNTKESPVKLTIRGMANK